MTRRVLLPLSLLTVFCTAALILLGAVVVGTGSGLSVPDWPLSFGQFFPPMVGGVVYEHSHRLLASGVGLLTIVLAIGLWKSAYSPLLKRLGILAVVLVIIQGIFGGITVLYHLPLKVNMIHASLAQLFFSLQVCLAALLWQGPVMSSAVPSPATLTLRKWSVLSTTIVFVQLLTGAFLRHSGQGLHLHMTLAALVAAFVIVLTVKIMKHARLVQELSKPGHWISIILTVQVVLGLLAWYRASLWFTTTHTLVGAMLLACSILVSMQTFRKLKVAA